jgi:NCS2 family nucleobase:cation symporter-2
VLAGFMNSFPDTAFAQNVGLIGLTRVRSRWVVTTCGVFLVILGLVPKFGQVVAHVPGPVIGGAATVMFAMVTAVGIRTLNKASFDNNHNLLIVAVSLSAGLIPAGAPTFYNKFPSDFQVIFGSSITSTVIVVFVLNIVFNHWTWRQPRTESTVRRRSGAMPSSSISPTAECIRTPGTASSARKASPPGKASPQVSGVG